MFKLQTQAENEMDKFGNARNSLEEKLWKNRHVAVFWEICGRHKMAGEVTDLLQKFNYLNK